MTRDAVLLIAHGTVTDLDDLPEFLLHIRHGRPASPALIEELRRRYRAIGGSPLLEITRAQATALEKRLGLQVLVGMRLWDPTLEQAFRDAARRNIDRLCVLPLAPFSAHVYAEAANRAYHELASELGASLPSLIHVPAWGTAPELVDAHVRQIAAVVENSDAALILTAHSLPERVISAGDLYAEQVQQSAEAISAGLGQPCRLAYQSQGADGGKWLGPELHQVLEETARAGARQVVVAPFGFLADHVETLYDLDIDASERARALGLDFRRVPALNADDKLVRALGAVALRALG